MRQISAPGIHVTAALLCGAMAGCASNGSRYAEVIAEAPPPEGYARIVLLRPDQRFDNYSLSRALIDVNGREFGKLSYGGFLYVDVKDEETVVESGVRNQWAGNCALRIRTKPGDTIYLDVTPRPVGAVDFVGVAVGAAIPGGDVSTVGGVLADAATSGATGAVVGAATEAIIYADKPCGGPFRMKPLAPDDAKKHLERLSWSG